MAIVITGMDKALAKLEKLGKQEQILRPVLVAQQKKIQKALKKYPPPPTNSRYVRTYKLRNSWQTSTPLFTPGGSLAAIYSDGSARTKYGHYAPYVMEAARQASIHRGRWHTTKSVEEDFRAEVIRAVQRAIERAIK